MAFIASQVADGVTAVTQQSGTAVAVTDSCATPTSQYHSKPEVSDSKIIELNRPGGGC